MEKFDYIVIGSGSAGGTVAARLSEDPNTTVCVLEAGGRDYNPFIHIPAGFMKTLVDPSVNWLYESEGSEGTEYMHLEAKHSAALHLLMAISIAGASGWILMAGRSVVTAAGDMLMFYPISNDRNAELVMATKHFEDGTAT